MIVFCDVLGCVFQDVFGQCTKDNITISDRELRADGFYPRCTDYEEDEEN